MSAGAAIARSVLSDQVRDRLIREILDGRYAPGERIVETRVARELGTSQAPVREALRDLEGLGLVEMEAFRGARVRRPAARELLEAFTVRGALEAYAATLALPRIADEDVAGLRALLGEMRAAIGAVDTKAAAGIVDPAAAAGAAAVAGASALAEADAAFHGRLVGLACNATLDRLWPMLEPAARTFLTSVARGPALGRLVELHAPVVDALDRRDAAALRTAIERYTGHLAEMLRTQWPDGPPERTR